MILFMRKSTVNPNVNYNMYSVTLSKIVNCVDCF